MHPGDVLTDAHQVLDADGRPLTNDYDPPLADEHLVKMYREMVLARHFDHRMISLQRQGQLGTYAPMAGQEGSQFGSMYALAEEDWVVYQYREHGAVISRGDLANYIRYWMGYEKGNAALIEHNIAPLNISIASHIPHATGMAWAAKLKGKDHAVVCHFGDGATSEGDFHEGLNFAGVFDVPVVFICNNNGWAISHPAERQTASESFAAKASAYGFSGVRVDGMDPLATYEVLENALRRAKDPEEGERRPTLVETVQYRFDAHTTADDPDVYRNEADVAPWRERDPLPRLETFLRERGSLDNERVDAIKQGVETDVAEAIEMALATDPDPDNLFAEAYADPTARVSEQHEYLRNLRGRQGDDTLLRED